MACHLEYIPEHLHKNGRPDLNEFENEERLFIRIHPKHPTPFQSITLANLSLNRDGGSKNLSKPEDVLWDINESTEEQKYDQEIKLLMIAFQNDDPVRESPSKIIDNGDDLLEMILTHKPLECNYSHCDFDFKILPDEIVTKENWKSTLGSRTYKKLRQKARLFLHTSILQNELKF